MYPDPTGDAAIGDEGAEHEFGSMRSIEIRDDSFRGWLRRFLADYVGRPDNPIAIRALLEDPDSIECLQDAASQIAAYVSSLSPEITSKLEEYRRRLEAEEAQGYEIDFRDGILACDWRFQYIIGPYIVDFFRQGTVIELDGPTHDTTEKTILDEIEKAYLESRGFTLHRFGRVEAEEYTRGGKAVAVERGWIPEEWTRPLAPPFS